MIRETEYRKQALARWQQENEQTKAEAREWAINRSMIIKRWKKKIAEAISHVPLFGKTNP